MQPYANFRKEAFSGLFLCVSLTDLRRAARYGLGPNNVPQQYVTPPPLASPLRARLFFSLSASFLRLASHRGRIAETRASEMRRQSGGEKLTDFFLSLCLFLSLAKVSGRTSAARGGPRLHGVGGAPGDAAAAAAAGTAADSAASGIFFFLLRFRFGSSK